MLGTEAVVLGSPQGSVGWGGGLLGLEKWNPVHLRDLEDLLVLKKSTSWEIVISHVQIPPQSTSVSLSYITPPTHVLLLLTLLPLPFLQAPDSLHQTSPHPYPPPHFVHAPPASSILSPAKPCPHAQPWPLSSAPPLTDAGPPLLPLRALQRRSTHRQGVPQPLLWWPCDSPSLGDSRQMWAGQHCVAQGMFTCFTKLGCVPPHCNGPARRSWRNLKATCLVLHNAVS